MLESLFQAITKWKPLDEAEQHELFDKINNGSEYEAEQAREKLIKHHIWLPCFMVNNHYRRQVQASVVDKEDLVQAGIQQMIENAIPKFDPDRGYKFATYARWWILDGMSRVLSDLSPVRVPDTLRKIQKKIDSLDNDDEDLSTKELAKKIGEKERQVEIAKRLPEIYPLEFSEEKNELPEPAQKFVQDDDSTDFTVDVAREKLREKLEKMMERSLTDKEEMVLRHRIAWDGDRKTLRELDSEMDVCYERVRQIENEAREKLRNYVPESFMDFIGDTGRSNKRSPIRID